jgi:hypothetical protein
MRENTMKKLNTLCTASLLALVSHQALAAGITVEVQNLTQGMYFTPVAVVAHIPDASLFEVGEEASPEIQEMAEGGSLAGLTALGGTISADILAEPAAGPLGPTAKVSGSFMTADGNTVLSVVAMILPSNDDLSGLNAWDLSQLAVGDSWSTTARVYDSGTEINSEASGTMPGPADGGEGFNPMRNDTGFVAMHPGVVSGDDGLSSSVLTVQHKFDNPAIRIKVTRTE